jgi:hypothetical protein
LMQDFRFIRDYRDAIWSRLQKASADVQRLKAM